MLRGDHVLAKGAPRRVARPRRSVRAWALAGAACWLACWSLEGARGGEDSAASLFAGAPHLAGPERGRAAETLRALRAVDGEAASEHLAAPPQRLSSDEAKQRLVGSEIVSAGDERKLRATIESILRDQEELRMSMPMKSGANLAKVASSAGLATAASLTVFLSQPWCAALMPTITGLMFIVTTSAESSGIRSKGLARLHSATASSLASQQETILAEADIRKALLPFGVGLTAIFSAACVSLRLFNSRVASGTAEGDYNPLSTFNVLLLLCTVSAVFGALSTCDQYLRMRTTLTLQPEEQTNDNETEWERRRLPSVTTEPTTWERLITVGTALGICLSPLAIQATIIGFNVSGMDPGAQFSQQLQETADESAVVISAIAGTLASLVYLIAEKDFADAEQRIAVQAKQSALSELFFAQALAEAAGLAVRSAVVGFVLGVGTLLVEGVGPVIASAALWPWPAHFGTVGATLRAKLVGYEANAAYLEGQRARKGDPTLVQESALSSTVDELQRIRTDVFRVDRFTDDVRSQMLQLPVGKTQAFPKLRREDRRKVHSIAAELGFASQSIYDGGQRVVMVANERGAAEPERSNLDLRAVFGQLADDGGRQVQALLRDGIPEASKPSFNAAVSVAALSFASPLLTSEIGVELATPFAAGALALQTVLQERNSKRIVGRAKRETAKLEQRLAGASARLALATVALASLPTCASVGMTAAIASCICFICDKSLPVYAFSAMALMVAITAYAAAVQRQRRVRKYVSAALDQVDGPGLPADILHSRRRWLAIGISLALLIPGSILQRLTLAITVITFGTALILPAASSELSAGEFYVARAERVLARTEAWSQEASCASRALPFGSAAAIVNTLLATALVSSVGPISVVFSAIGLGVCARALQFSNQSERYAQLAEREREDIQVLEARMPSPWRGRSATYAATVSRAGRSEVPTEGYARSDLFVRDQQRRRRRSWRRLLKGGARDLWSWARPRAIVSFLRLWQEDPPESEYGMTPAERAVESVRGDMDEVRVSVRSSEKNWLRTGSAVTLSTLSAILAPAVLSSYFVGVILPVAGAGLTLFAVAAESNARRSVAASKVWSAELSEVTNFLEEMTSSSAIYRHRLVAMTGVTACMPVLSLVVEHPWRTAAALGPLVHTVQAAVQVALVGVTSFISARSIRQAASVLHWSRQVREQMAAPIAVASVCDLRAELPREVLRQDWLVQQRPSPLALLAALPPWVLAFWPPGRPLGQRVVAATAAGGFLVCTALLVAEQASTRAELSQAARARTFSLADAFSNEAEQQAALLPLASAATIAISALITFGTEVNPYAASALTILQGIAWIVASRKGLAAKFESTASLQVEQVSESDRPAWKSGEGDNMPRRFRRFLLRM